MKKTILLIAFFFVPFYADTTNAPTKKKNQEHLLKTFLERTLNGLVSITSTVLTGALLGLSDPLHYPQAKDFKVLMSSFLTGSALPIDPKNNRRLLPITSGGGLGFFYSLTPEIGIAVLGTLLALYVAHEKARNQEEKQQ